MKAVPPLLVCLAVGACTSFGGSGNTSPAPGAADDGGPSAEGAPGVVEAGPAAEGGAGPDARAAERTAFSDEFERAGQEVMGPWSGLEHPEAAVVDGQHARNGGGAFHVTVAGNATESGQLYSSRLAAPKFATYTFSFFTTDASRQVNLAELYVDGPSGASSAIVVSFHAGALYVGRQAEPTGDYTLLTDVTDLSNVVTTNTWHEVAIDVDLSPPTPTFAVSFDEKSVDLKHGDTVDPVAYDGTVALGCGINYAETGTRFDIWFDDVSLGVE